MKAVFVCTHGHAAEELIHSAELICGEQENVGYTDFKVGETLETLHNKIMNELSQLEMKDGILMLTDLKGGTPFNVLVGILFSMPRVELLTGVNIPMLLETFISREALPLESLVAQVYESGRSGIYRYEKSDLKIEEEF